MKQKNSDKRWSRLSLMGGFLRLVSADAEILLKTQYCESQGEQANGRKNRDGRLGRLDPREISYRQGICARDGSDRCIPVK